MSLTQLSQSTMIVELMFLSLTDQDLLVSLPFLVPIKILSRPQSNMMRKSQMIKTIVHMNTWLTLIKRNNKKTRRIRRTTLMETPRVNLASKYLRLKRISSNLKQSIDKNSQKSSKIWTQSKEDFIEKHQRSSFDRLRISLQGIRLSSLRFSQFSLLLIFLLSLGKFTINKRNQKVS